MDRIAPAAELLFEMRRTLTRTAALPADVVPQTIAEGYQVQDALVRRMLAEAGGHPIGYKAACTSVLAQQQLGVDGPFCGVLMSHSSHRSGVALSAAKFTTRIVEAEFAFEVARDVPTGPTHTADSISEFLGAAIPSIEIVNHRYHDWKAVGAPSLIADNAIHGSWIEGQPHTAWKHIDLASHAVSLRVNGETVRTGSGAAVLGNPLNVVAWLANELPKLGKQLRRGDKVTTGTAIDVYPANPGDRITADFGVLGSVDVTFEA